MRVEVTEEDIERGRAEDCECCPIALAVRRAFVEGNVSVDDNSILVGEELYKSPKSVQRFIKKFDEREPQDPFSFELGEEDRLPYDPR